MSGETKSSDRAIPTTFNTLGDIFNSLTELLRPPERITISDASEKYVQLSNPGSYIGPYRNGMAPYMVEPMNELQSRVFNSLAFVGPAQSAKALALDTPIATPFGWTTMGELRPGHLIFGDDGQPCRVVVCSPVRYGNRCFKITFDDKSEIVADAGHEWTVRDDYSEKWKTVTTDAMSRKFTYGKKNRTRFSIPITRPIECAEIALPVDPYTLGCWLGDGSVNTSQLTLNADDADEITDIISSRGYNLDMEDVGDANSVTVTLAPTRYDMGVSELRSALRNMGLLCDRTYPLGNKHIPSDYLRASISQRMELLRGLMDTDGWCSSGVCGFDSSISCLADDVYELLISLGYKVRRTLEENPRYSYRGETRIGKPSHGLTFVVYAEDEAPFHLKRKIGGIPSVSQGRPTYTGRRRIVDITEVTSVPVRCIGVDNTSHLFLAGRQMVPTHNTQALILNWLAYSIKVDGMDMIIYSPTQSASRDFSRRRVDRMHRHSPELGSMLLGSREDDNVFDKMYKNGMLLNLSHPTVTEFAGRPVGRIALTDYDRMPDDVGGDGSPFDLGSKRTTTFRSFAMTVAESSPSRPVENPRWIANTPHEAPPCTGIMSLYNRGDRRRWYWPCPECGAYFEGQWKDLEWDVKNSVLASAETVRMICPAKGCEIAPHRRATMQKRGKWLKDGESVDPDTGAIVGDGIRSSMASFWLNGIAANFTTWSNLVVSYLNAMTEFERTQSEDSLKKFYNTDLGVPYLPKSQESELLPEHLKARAETLPVSEVTSEERINRVHNPRVVDFVMEPMVPANVRFLVATIDVQNSMFVVQVHGIMPGEPFDMVIVDRFQIRHSRREEAAGGFEWVKPAGYLEDWNEITTEVLNRTYALSDGSGRRMAIKMTGCDSGGREGVTTNGYAYHRLLRSTGDSGRFQLLKGDHLVSRPRAHITFPDSNRKDKLSAARGDVPVMFLNSNLLKDALRGRCDCMIPGKGMLRFGTWLHDAFYSEMCVEVRDDKGWHNPKNLRNEAWDLCYYAMGICVSALIRVEGIDWEKPPGWAAPWDQNDLVVAGKNATFATVKNSGEKVDMARFGRLLG